MTLIDILVIAFCVLVVGITILLAIINKKKGKRSCCCDCSKCSACKNKDDKTCESKK